MSVIHQMYCTHCTHGSSALEQRQGEISARMLGYSVRASSLEGDALRQAYRQVERYVSYHLPKDTPGEQKLLLTAATAPQRLIFIPMAGAWQVIGLVCYRQRDTEGRPGSYFAHLLCREIASKGEPWTLLDALRLWQAPHWVMEDSAEHPFVLPSFDSLDSMLDDRATAIDDRSLLAFLRGDDRSFGARLPDRWRDLVPSRRVAILRNMLDALLTVGTTRRQVLLVAVEPEVAALLFYAIGRLLPPGALRASVSISTFEAATDRLTTILAATTFSDPATAEFRGDTLRGRGIALNTFANSPSDTETGSQYGEAMVRCFLEEGPEVVNRRLAMIVASGPERIETLDDFAKTERAVERLFQSGGNGSTPWHSDSSLTDYARRLARERLEALHGAESTLNGLCGGPKHAVILELAGTVGPGSDIDRAFRYLLNKLPEEKIAAFVSHVEIDDAWKIELLKSRIGATGRAPAGCEWFWAEEELEAPLESTRRKSISIGVLSDLPARAVVSLLGSLDALQRMVAVEGLLEACDRSSDRWTVFAEVVRRFDIASLLALRQTLGTRLFEVPAAPGEALADRLREILNTLHEHSAEFSERLDFLDAGRKWLSDPSDIRRLDAWIRCRKAICELIGMKELNGWNQLAATRRLETAAQHMTEAALEAMPTDLLEDDRQGSAKQERLRAIGRKLAGDDEFLPTRQWQNEALWKKIGWRIEMGSWPSAPLHKLAKGPADRKQMWIAAAVAAAVLLAVLGVIGLATIGTGGGKSQNLVVERGETREPAQPAPTKSPSDVIVPLERDGLSEGALSSEPLMDVPQPSAEGSVVPEPIVFHRGTPDTEPKPNEEPPDGQVAGERPLVSIQGTFAAEMSPVAGLKPPAVALVTLHVQGVDGGTLPEWVSTRYTIGAVVQEQNDARAARYLDFADLAAKDEAELFDGVEKVLVQFRFARKSAPTSESGGILATSYSWAEVPIQPAQRYDIRFALAPSALSELERLAAPGE